jgi:hypothetical protein
VPLWYREQQLTADPLLDDTVRVIHFEEISHYPLAARFKHIQGVVGVRVQISKTGGVKSAVALSGAKELIDDCVENALKWQFDASKATEAIIVYVFQFKGLCVQCVSSFEFYPPNLVFVATGDQVVVF